jgi:hypothetical protein
VLATFQGAPAGTITFTDSVQGPLPGCGSLGLDSQAAAACTVTFSAPGAHLVTASYSGVAGAIMPSTCSRPHTVLSGQELLRFAGVASQTGNNGTRWRSELVLASPGEPTHVMVSLTPRGATSAVASLTLDLNADEVRRLPDLYEELAAEDGAGLLAIISHGADGQARPARAWVRTYNQAAGATFGQDVPGVGSLQATPAEEARLFPVHTPDSLSSGTRSNLLLQNFAASPLTVAVTSGTLTRTITIPPGVYVQQDNVGAWLGLPVGVAVITVTANGPWAGTVSSVDASSGDPTTVRGLASAAQAEALFPGVASRVGRNGTAWRSEVTLHNPTASSQTAVLEILDRGTTTVVGNRSYPLAPGETLQIADLYQALGAGTGAGMLRVTGGVLAWVRTYNQSESSSFGQDVPAVAAADAVPAGAVRLFPVAAPADEATGFRSNLLLVNHESTVLPITVTATGHARTVFILAGAYEQLNSVGSWLGLEPGWCVVSVKANGRWSGVVSTIDPVSGDPTTVLGLP